MKILPPPLALKPQVLFCCLAFCSFHQYSKAADSFAETPLHLQNQSTTIYSSFPKPNVMLLIDDSSSMNDAIPGTNTSRLYATKQALYSVLDTYQGDFNWSLQTLWGKSNFYNNYPRPHMNFYTTNHLEVKKYINNIFPDGGTPTTRRYYEVANDAISAVQYRCQKSYIILMSDGDANSSCGLNHNNYPDFDRYYMNNPDAFFGTPSTYNLGQRKCYGGLHTFWDMNNGLAFFAEQLATKDIKTNGNDTAQKSWNDPLFEKQTINTYTIGFGGSLSGAGETYLRNAASAGKGFFATPKNGAELEATFKSMIEDIKKDSAATNPVSAYGTVAPAVIGNAVPDMAALVQLDTGSWSSQLFFYDTDTSGNVNTSTAPKQPSYTNRRVIMNTGSANVWADQPNNISGLDNRFFDLSGGTPVDQDEWKSTLLPWTVRSSDDNLIKSNAASKKYTVPYRLRETTRRNLGDILDSPVLTIGPQTGGRQKFLVTSANDGMVHLFKSDNNTAATNPYDLKLSYIPAAMERDSNNGGSTLGKTLKELAHEEYGKNDQHPHRYMVNGGFVLRQTPEGNKSKGQQIFMAGALGQGGRGAYALNIGGINRTNGQPLALDTNQSTWLNDVPLFETPKGTNNTLGYTIGTPQIGRVSISRTNNTVDFEKNIRYATFLASGYRSRNAATDNNETALYVYDTLGQEASSGTKANDSVPGKLLAKINVPNGKGGLSSPTLVDIDFDGIIDIAYAGDYGGNMYRFDLRNATPSEWNVTRIYEGSPTQPIVAAPAVSRRSQGNYVVIFGTGSDIYSSDLSNTAQQAVYGIFDDVSTYPATDITEVAKYSDDTSKIQVQTITTAQQNNADYRFLSNNPVNDTHKGWKIALPETGERVVIKPTMILRTAMISTRIYKTGPSISSNSGSMDVCQPTTTSVSTQSASWIMGINAATGGALTSKDARLDFRFIQKDAKSGIEYYANGLRQNGILSFSYIDMAKAQKGLAVTDDGDSGGSGTDLELGERSKIPKNSCFTGNATRFISGLTSKQANSSDAPETSTLGVSGPLCSAKIKRLSWREIF
ncbi:PilC family type IV pilus tip adhesin [Neisseria sp. S1]|uniref:PilC family type IV pilus tip adhesin n=1 Tax=Neisseria sp. S1 TaxID=3318354 RepID=UPI003A85F0C6